MRRTVTSRFRGGSVPAVRTLPYRVLLGLRWLRTGAFIWSHVMGRLLTAVAAQGYRMLTEELRSARDARRGFLEMGVAYVRFAVSHRAHFEVMYRPELYRPDDAEVREARAATAVLLYGSSTPDSARLAAGAAAWSLVHGLATLWLNGNLPEQLGNDPEEITRLVAPYLSNPETMTASADAGEGARASGPADVT